MSQSFSGTLNNLFFFQMELSEGILFEFSEGWVEVRRTAGGRKNRRRWGRIHQRRNRLSRNFPLLH